MRFTYLDNYAVQPLFRDYLSKCGTNKFLGTDNPDLMDLSSQLFNEKSNLYLFNPSIQHVEGNWYLMTCRTDCCHNSFQREMGISLTPNIMMIIEIINYEITTIVFPSNCSDGSYFILGGDDRISKLQENNYIVYNGYNEIINVFSLDIQRDSSTNKINTFEVVQGNAMFSYGLKNNIYLDFNNPNAILIDIFENSIKQVNVVDSSTRDIGSINNYQQIKNLTQHTLKGSTNSIKLNDNNYVFTFHITLSGRDYTPEKFYNQVILSDRLSIYQKMILAQYYLLIFNFSNLFYLKHKFGFSADETIYLNFFALYNSSQNKILKISSPLMFMDRNVSGVVFPMSLVERQNEVIMSYGINDNECGFIFFELDEILGSLHDVDLLMGLDDIQRAKILEPELVFVERGAVEKLSRYVFNQDLADLYIKSKEDFVRAHGTEDVSKAQLNQDLSNKFKEFLSL